ncbi:DrmB family protein [Glycomyces rhizosphaerae]|uniref:DrmB family protein n=1 Tax=Glycomyces rhizosphaerae TaxID=2054422 RepID=A0ABV7Q0P8_9ACTN
MNRVLRVRQSQTIVPFGVGAVIDIQGESFVAAGTEHWPRGGPATEVRAPRLAQRLGVARFYAAPPTLNERFDSEHAPGAPYLRFPAWLFCRSCRRMRHWTWRDEQPGEAPRCKRCPEKPVLSPMRWVQICRDGHLGDVNWRWWAHWNAENSTTIKCTMQDSPIDFTVTDGKFGLEALDIVCRAPKCGARRNLLKLLGPSGMACTGRNPWQPAAEDCKQRTLVVQRTAGNLYYPTVYSALDIPQHSGGHGDADPLAAEVRAHDLWITLCGMDDTAGITALRPVIAAATGATEAFIDTLLAEERGELGTDGASAPPTAAATDFSREEWAAFTSDRPDLSRNFDIRTGSLGIEDEADPLWTELDGLVGRVVLADRLREVRALAGFSRYSPEARQLPVNTTRRSSWLPAVEAYGEGIFITLDEQRLAAWESVPSVRARAAQVDDDMQHSFQLTRLQAAAGTRVSPRFLLLHTLAHLLIRTLSFESGYNTASLRERVYGRPEHGQHGLLLYTAAGDAEGTLGGLVSQGEAPRLAETLLRTIESAAWCSADPLCLEHAGQGYEKLNRAACHACVLLPETSCEAGNTLLDRSMLIGGNGIPGYFESFAELARDAAALAVE